MRKRCSFSASAKVSTIKKYYAYGLDFLGLTFFREKRKRTKKKSEVRRSSCVGTEKFYTAI